MSEARLFALALMALSVAVAGSALLFQYVGGLAPCPLCLYQRWPWYAAAALGLLALFLGGRRAGAWVLGLSGLLLVAGAGVALYHVGVEQHWIAGPTACSGVPGGTAETVEALRAQLMGTAPVRCDEIAWSLFGVSMAGWNAILSLAVALFAFWGFRRLRAGAPA
jgi:disulfide bond formation protein DsbB